MMRVEHFAPSMRHARSRILLAPSSRPRAAPLMAIERELVDLRPLDPLLRDHALLLREARLLVRTRRSFIALVSRKTARSHATSRTSCSHFSAGFNSGIAAVRRESIHQFGDTINA